MHASTSFSEVAARGILTIRAGEDIIDYGIYIFKYIRTTVLCRVWKTSWKREIQYCSPPGTLLWGGLGLEAMSIGDEVADCEDCSTLPLGLIGFVMLRSWVLGMIGVRRCRGIFEW